MNQFNRIFRILWSKTKEQWVVTSELEGTGGKKQGKGLVSVFCAVLMAASILAAQDASALTGTGNAATVCTGTNATNTARLTPATCTATATDSLINTSSGIMETIGLFASPTITVDAAATGVTIDNSGALYAVQPVVVSVNATARGTTLVNQANGIISASSAARKYAVLFDVGSFDAGSSITNHGSIYISESGSRTAIAIGVLGNMVGHISNSSTGTIHATGLANSSSTLNVRAVYIAGDLSGALNNTCTIVASGTEIGNSSVPFVRGISTASLSGSLVNSGSISASMLELSSTAQAHAVGIDVLGTATGSLQNTNTGTIVAHATVQNGSRLAQAIGVGVVTLAGGTGLTNHGSIRATAKQTGGSATAYAISITNYNGVANNTGSIYAAATGLLTKERAEGLNIANMAVGAVLNNSGTISSAVSSASNTSKAYSLNILAAAGGTVNNQAGGVLKGNISTPAGLTLFDNAGTIDIPDGVTTASIAGSYSQQSGGVLKIGASSAASYAKLTTGPANLIAGSVIDVYTTPANTLFVGDTLTGVLTSTSLTSGTLKVTDNSNTLDFKAVIVGNQIDLQVTVADLTPPTITLNGAANVSVVQGSTYTDAGATALDNVDGDLTASMVTGGTFVDTSTTGNFTITYDVMDIAGNAATQRTRNITVTAASTTSGASTSSGGGCVAPSTGILPTLFTMLIGVGLLRRRKK